jgi:pimeloyl-ACP methyl ester carboxylesterase
MLTEHRETMSKIALVLALLSLGGCNTPPPWAGPTPTPQVEVEGITVVTENDCKLVGNLYHGEGETAVVLGHMGTTDQTSWEPFARVMADRGFTALTFDFCCYGESDCHGGLDVHLNDVRAAIGFLRDRGFDRIACVGGSMGAEACANAALVEELVGLVFIAGPQPTNVIHKEYPADLVNPTMPKLFIVTDNDRYYQVVRDTQSLYEASPEPRELKVFPGNVHGTELFGTEYGDEFRQMLIEFLEGL